MRKEINTHPSITSDARINANGIARCARTNAIPSTPQLVSWLNDGMSFNFHLTLATRKAEANGLINSPSNRETA